MNAERSVSVRACDSFSAVAPLYAHLDGWQGHPMLSPEWLGALEESGCVREEHGWIPYHLVLTSGRPGVSATEDPASLIGVVPMYIKLNSEGEFIFDHAIARAAPRFGVDYFPKLLVAVPFTPATGPRLLVARGVDTELARSALRAALETLVDRLGVSSANVLFLPGAEADALEKMGMLHRHSLQFQWHNQGYRDFEEFLAQLPSKRRTQIRRERRAPAEQGLTIATLGGDALTPAIADTAYELYLTTVDKFTWGRRYLNRRFFEIVFSKLKRAMELVTATDERGRVVAGAVNVRGENTLFGRYWGTHGEVPFLHFNVCFYHSIERCIRDGIAHFEPGAGGEHKLARGFVPTITHSVHHIRDPRLAAVVGDFFSREREVIDAEVRGDAAEG